MRVAWFTPASGDSGIVEYSRSVLAALRSVCEPTLFAPGPADRFPDDVEAVDFSADPGALERLPGFDAVFYHLGNNVHYHAAIWDVARTYPGIVVLHDRVMHHFFLGYFTTRLHDPERYRERMGALYGERGRTIAEQMLGHARPPSERELLRYSFIEDAVRGARGVIVHSGWHAAAIREVWPGPLCELWLPAQPAPMMGSSARNDDPRVTLLTVGHVEFNKHVDKVVALYARDPDLVARSRYLVAGVFHPDAPYVRELAESISCHSLAGSVELLGHLSAADLDREAARADVFVNLRWPNFEGCSASLMYQLGFGAPVVVYRSGSFAELPDDAVVKVTPGDDAELHRRLRELLASERRREEVGAAGRRFADRRTPAAYARRLAEFAADVARSAPRRDAATRVGHRLAELGADPRMEGVQQVTRDLVKLFGAPPT